MKQVPEEKLYNAFIMPFNKEDNMFIELDDAGNVVSRVTDDMGNVGEAIGDWKDSMKNYERIQGIVMDTRFLMYNYLSMPDQRKCQLASCIEKVNIRGPVPKPRT